MYSEQEVSITNVIYITLAVIGCGIIFWFAVNYLMSILLRLFLFRNERSYYRVINTFYEQHFVRNSEGSNIDLWWLPHQGASDVVLYLHGNSGRVPHLFPPFCRDHHVLSPSYAGYGLSEGKPSENNICETAELAYQWLLKRGFREDQIIIWGHSLGGFPAVHLAGKHPDCKKLVVVNSFASLKGLCRRQFSALLPLFMKNRFNTVDHARKVEGKVVQFCYRHDESVPFEECKLLFDNYKTRNKKLVELEGDCHEHFDVESTLRD